MFYYKVIVLPWLDAKWIKQVVTIAAKRSMALMTLLATAWHHLNQQSLLYFALFIYVIGSMIKIICWVIRQTILKVSCNVLVIMRLTGLPCIGLFTHSWAIWLSAPELVWELNWELNCSSISGSIGTQLWLPWSRIFGFGSGSAALAPWEPFHYINPPNFFVCIFHVSDNFKK